MGLYSNTRQRAEEFRKEIFLDCPTGTVDDIAGNKGHILAYIATTNTEHYKHTKMLLDKGYDVLCEKPLTLSPTQSEELFKLAETKGKTLQENLWSLFVPSTKHIEQAAMGCVNATFSFCVEIPYDETSRQWQPEQGGCVFDLGIYTVAVSYTHLTLPTIYSV